MKKISFKDIDEKENGRDTSRISRALPYFYLIVEACVLIYTGSHAWHLSNLYTDTPTMLYVQFAGMLLVEVAIFYCLFLLHTNRVADGDQRWATIATFLIGIAFVGLVVLADTQIVRGTLWHWLSVYLDYIPLTPVIMFVLLFIVNQLDTEKAQKRAQDAQRLEQERKLHLIKLELEAAKYDADLKVINTQLGVKDMLSNQIREALNNEDVKQLVIKTAKDNAPRLLAEAGLNVDNETSTPKVSTPPKVVDQPLQITNLVNEDSNGVAKKDDHPLA